MTFFTGNLGNIPLQSGRRQGTDKSTTIGLSAKERSKYF